MIKVLIELLNSSDYYGVSERVEIAKGKYQMHKEVVTWKIVWNKIKNRWLIRQ